MNKTPFQLRMWQVVEQLAEGEVVSFGDIAGRAGKPNASRAAGRMLSKIRDSDLPWWRVVYSNGKLPLCNPTLQTERLEAEGVSVKNGRVTAAPLGRFEQ
ncbi:MGMT family protein [Mariniblastus sp.]|nr:MGMT family protein [Mariniblastus sp.]